MKKLGIALATAIAAMSVGALPASATGTTTDAPYPPVGTALILNPSTTTPGSSVVASFSGCQDGETVNFVLNGTTVAGTCGGAAAGFRRPTGPTGPIATVTLTAPAAVGAYPVTATGVSSLASASATLTVVAVGELPATGSDSAPTVQIATGIVAVGVGLAAVGGLRRRKRAAA